MSILLSFFKMNFEWFIKNVIRVKKGAGQGVLSPPTDFVEKKKNINLSTPRIYLTRCRHVRESTWWEGRGSWSASCCSSLLWKCEGREGVAARELQLVFGPLLTPEMSHLTSPFSLWLSHHAQCKRKPVYVCVAMHWTIKRKLISDNGVLPLSTTSPLNLIV